MSRHCIVGRKCYQYLIENGIKCLNDVSGLNLCQQSSKALRMGRLLEQTGQSHARTHTKTTHTNQHNPSIRNITIRTDYQSQSNVFLSRDFTVSAQHILEVSTTGLTNLLTLISISLDIDQVVRNSCMFLKKNFLCNNNKKFVCFSFNTKTLEKIKI